MKPRLHLLLYSALGLSIVAGRLQAQLIYTPYTIRTLAGSGVLGSADGLASAAQFFQPYGVAVDKAGNCYVADHLSHTIRRVTPRGSVTTLAGRALVPGSADGTGSLARFNQPTGVAVAGDGNVFVADCNNFTIRKVTPAGDVSTVAGTAGVQGDADGIAGAARFRYPYGIAIDDAGNIYVADTYNCTIRKITLDGNVTTTAGLPGNPGSDDGIGGSARFDRPLALAVDRAGIVFVADTFNDTIRKVTATGEVTTLVGEVRQPGNADGFGSAARFDFPFGIAVDSGTNLYVTSGTLIRRITQGGAVTTLAGAIGGSADGTGSSALFANPIGIAVDAAANIYVADSGNNTIRKGTVATIILNGFGFAQGAFGFQFSGPLGQLVFVESSTNLTDWIPLATNHLSSANNFTDQQSGSGNSRRFYRLRLP